MGSEAEEILNSFNLTEENSKKYDTVLARFDNFFVVKRNVIFERAKFNSRKQEMGETVDSFITALFSLSEHCEYQNLKDEMIRDRIVVGLRDTKLSLKLQLDSNLTLDSAITQARQSESVHKQQDALRNQFTGTSEAKVDFVRKKFPKQKGKVFNHHAQKGEKEKMKDEKTCKWCAGNSHSKASCPARESVCGKCKKKGHWARACMSNRSKGVHIVEADENDDSDFLGCVVSSLDGGSKPWMAEVSVGGQKVNFKLDTGADVSLIPQSIYDKCDSSNLSKADRVLKGVGDYRIKLCGKILTELSWEDMTVTEEVYVAKDSEMSMPLLGRPAIEKLGMVVKDDRIDSVDCREIYRDKFPQLFSGLGNTGRTYRIKLKPDAKPFALSTPRRIALPLRDQVKEELQRMEQMGIISPVTEPTDWCAGIVVVPKPGNKVRICVDLTKLNQNVCRENHPLPAIDETLGQLAGAKYFTKLDANSGFHQVPLAEESAKLTTFITPFGRYCYNRLPFGISSAPEVFQRQMSQIIDGIPGVVCQMDDILVSGTTIEEHDIHLKSVLEKVGAAGVTLNWKKCEFAKTCVKFLGFILDEAGIRPDPGKMQAIVEMDEPTSVTEVRRFFGMVNFLCKFSPNLAQLSKPIRDLLKSDSEWCWDTPQQKAFKDIQMEIASNRVLAHYDPKKPTKVSADASSYGLGAVLQQEDDTGWKPVAYASRSLTPTEQRYAQIEKEALALTWACEKFACYIIGLTFIIETDHKPLLSLLGEKELDMLPPRVQRFRMRLMRFDYRVTYVPGKTLVIADTLSRAPLPDDQEGNELSQEATAYVQQVLRDLPASEKRLDEIREKLQNDEVCRELMKLCREGWPLKAKLKGPIKAYHPFHTEMTVEDGLLLRGKRLIIPIEMRLEILDLLHQGHQGIVKCRERAKQSVWWPGLSQQLKSLVENCTQCIRERRNAPEPLMPTELPERPWQKVGTDLFTLKSTNYLLVVDYYSRFIEIERLTDTTSDGIINHLKSQFARHGIPEVLVSDNGPQFSSYSFHKFSEQYRFSHVTSSPTFAQSNGEAERAVRTVKGMMKKESDPYLALLAYRNTPLQNGYSPAELLMSRRLRTTVPVLPETLFPKTPDAETVKQKENTSKGMSKKNFDSNHRARLLDELDPGDVVWTRHVGKSVVKQKTDLPRSYIVETPSGSIRRNRRDLVKCSTPTRSPTQDEIPEKPPSPVVDQQATRSTRSGRTVVPPTRLDL